MKGIKVNKVRIALCAALLVTGPAGRCAFAQEPVPPRSGPGMPHPPGERGIQLLPGERGIQQPPVERGIPDLTDQQKEQLKKLRLALAEKTLPLRNLLGEKEAHLRTLVTARVADAAAIEKTAEEIGDLRSQVFKAEVLNEVSLRGLLTEDQKAWLDALPAGRGPMPPPGGHGPMPPPDVRGPLTPSGGEAPAPRR